ncbi:Spermidine hydroxycinnamoyl transferase [Linum perenne]
MSLTTSRLIDSLSQTLVHFYPLAGRLGPIGEGDRFELDCNAKGAMFIEAVAETTSLDELGESCGCGNTDFQPLIPKVDYTRPIREWPLLLVQLTKFSCGSMSLCFNMSHVVVDGMSDFSFLNEWARIAHGERIGKMPFLDRKVLRAGEPPLSRQPPRFDPLEFENPPVFLSNDTTDSTITNGEDKETKFSILKLTKAQLKMLKDMANETLTASHRPYTTYETVTAHTWRCACKARKLKPDQLTAVIISVDSRRRTNPPLPETYFGNAILDVKAVERSEDIVSKPLGYATEKIRKEVEKVDEEYISSAIEYLKNEPDLSKFQLNEDDIIEPWCGSPNLEVTSWQWLPFQGLDFGFGKEAYIGTGYELDGVVTLLPSDDQDGDDGSFWAWISLGTDHMEAFEHHLYNDIIVHV